jgi:hypothetical protein
MNLMANRIFVHFYRYYPLIATAIVDAYFSFNIENTSTA